MNDIVARAKAHSWWYSDTNMATNLIHEVEQVTEQLQSEKGYVKEYREAYCKQAGTIAKLKQANSELHRELRRLVEIVDREVELPDGSTPDTAWAHYLLGDLNPEDVAEYTDAASEQTEFNRYVAGDRR